jgi:hypothetical protein
MKIEQLIEQARNLVMSKDQMNEQRRNFAFGSSNIENDRISRETVQNAEQLLRDSREK